MKKILGIVIIVSLFLSAAVHAAWTNPEVVEGGNVNVGEWASLGLDDDDNPHIVYYSSDENNIRYAWWEDGEWQVDTNPAWGGNEDPSGYVYMDLDESGMPHILFEGGNAGNMLYYTMRHTAGQWDNPMYVSINAESASIVRDADGEIYTSIHYTAPDKGLHFSASNDTPPWSLEDVESHADETEVGVGSSIDISEHGDIYISFIDHNTISCETKHKGDHAGSSWSNVGTGSPDDSVDDKGNITRMALSKGDNIHPHIVYTNNDSGYVMYAYFDGGSWTNEEVAPNGGADDVAIDVQESDRPHIAFYDQNNRCLKYARKKKDGEWRVQTVEDYSSGNTPGKYPSIKLDSNGDPQIAYYDHSMGQLKYSYWEDNDDDDAPIPDLKADKEVRIGNNKFDPTQGDECRIMYDLSHEQEITIKIYTLTGRLIKTIIENEVRGEGKHGEDTWDGFDIDNQDVPNGIYYIVIESSDDWKKVNRVAIVKGENKQ